MFLHKLNKIFCANCMVNFRLPGIYYFENCTRESRILCLYKFGEFTYNNTKPLCRIAWHFWTNTNSHSGEVSLIISVDIRRKRWDSTLCLSSTVASTFNSRQYLQSLEIPKQISYVLRGIKQAISRKLVRISDCRVSSFFFAKQFPAAGYLDT